MKISLLLALCVVCATGVHTVYATTFTVTTTADTTDMTLGDGICADVAGQCTLRAAIAEANTVAGLDIVQFNIVPAGPKTFLPASGYGNIVEGITIDGTTQPGYVGNPIIEIDGSAMTSGFSAPIVLNAPNNLIKGLVINNFQMNYSGPGILISGGDYTVVKNSYLGTDLTGMIAKPNNEGIFVDGADHVTIGGPAATDRNLISGNAFQGIHTTGEYNRIEGNYIGTDVTGNNPLPNNTMNQSGGVSIWDNNTLLKGNVISGNQGYGLYMIGDHNVVESNYIGTNKTGTAALPNTSHGISVASVHVNSPASPTTYNTIGGSIPVKRNIIAGNGGDGIHMDRWIGCCVNAYGKDISNNTIQNNYVGIGANGTQSLPNQGHGIYINAADKNVITENIIAHNLQNAIAVNFGIGVFATRDRFSKNSIYNNGQLGIDLAMNGITSNDTLDTDVGPNMLQNNPVVKSVMHVGNTTKVTGTFGAASNNPFTVELYASPTNTPGQGKDFLGSFTLNTNAQGVVNPVSLTIPSYVPTGQYITALAIDAVKGDTSEFSNAVVVS